MSIFKSFASCKKSCWSWEANPSFSPFFLGTVFTNDKRQRWFESVIGEEESSVKWRGTGLWDAVGGISVFEIDFAMCVSVVDCESEHCYLILNFLWINIVKRKERE